MKEIMLTKGKTVIVDDEDFGELSKHSWYAWFNKTDGKYRALRNYVKDGKSHNLKMHRQIMGVIDPMIKIDHIDGNPLNNQRSNLRVATSAQNNQNAKKQAGRSSKYKGVIWNKKLSKWRGRIQIPNPTGNGPGKLIDLGLFREEKLAALAYDAKAKEIFGSFAKLNFEEGIAS